MKILLISFITFCAQFATSCQKSITAGDVSNGTDTTVTPGGTDTTITPPVTGALLTRSVSVWKDSPTGPDGDSDVTEYTYDAAKFLVKKKLTGSPAIVYNRDNLERLTSITIDGSAAYTRVYYGGTSSGKVAYTLAANDATAVPDSNGTAMVLGDYQTYTYDNSGNVIQLQLYVNNTLNIGYDFEYDNKVNALFSTDDARLPYEWGYITSPNNIIKQINHYGNPPTGSDDYVTYAYQYNAGGKPVSGLHSGTAIGTQTETIKFYY